MAGHKKARLNTIHLGRQRRVFVPDIIRKDIRLGIKVVQPVETAPAAPGGMAERGGEKAIGIERLARRGGGIGNLATDGRLDVSGILAHGGDAQRLGIGQARVPVGGKKGFPVVGDAEDGMGTGEEGLELGLDVV